MSNQLKGTESTNSTESTNYENNSSKTSLTNNTKQNSNKIVSLLVSHNSRMQCLLKEILKTKNGYTKTRFQNCAIVCMELRKNTPLSINLVYQGELDEDDKYSKPNEKVTNKKKGYYFLDMTQTRYLKIEKKEFSTESCNTESNVKLCNKLLSCICSRTGTQSVNFKNIINNFDNTTYVFYIIRHAEGFHNTLEKSEKFKASFINRNSLKDPKLSYQGINQSINAGNELYKILMERKDYNINYLFVSDLVRTRMTLALICYTIYENKVMNKNKKMTLFNPKMIVLPCSHEINYEKGSVCNGSSLMSTISGLGLENITGVKYRKDGAVIDKEYVSTKYFDGNGKNKNSKNYLEVKIYNNPENLSPSLSINFETMPSGENKKYTFDSLWNYYTKFYGYGIRGDIKFSRESCRNTSMIRQAIKIIGEENQ
jgi:phosphohistidine phosphatase SixA